MLERVGRLEESVFGSVQQPGAGEEAPRGGAEGSEAGAGEAPGAEASGEASPHTDAGEG